MANIIERAIKLRALVRDIKSPGQMAGAFVFYGDCSNFQDSIHNGLEFRPVTVCLDDPLLVLISQ